MNGKVLIAGAVSGFVGALVIDMNAWSKSTPKGVKNKTFDWGLAFQRWLAGAGSGAAAAMGWEVTVSVPE